MTGPSDTDIYVAGRVRDVPTPPRPSVKSRCARCNAEVWIEEERLSLALACREIVCVPCIAGKPRRCGRPPV
jgi:hypothetical protein